MVRYNKKTKQPAEVVVTHEGGVGYKLKPRLELLSILSNDFDNTYYESLGEREKRLKNLLSELAEKDPIFVAKALVYTRSVVGQRSVTHFGSVFLAPYLSGNSIGKRFYSKRDRKGKRGGIVHRLDDMLEILSAYMHFNPGKALPSAMKKGFRSAIENADSYELAKYQGKNRMVSLIDVVNMTHPSSTPKQGRVGVSRKAYTKAIKGTKWENTPLYDKGTIPALHALVLGLLTQQNTVEDKNTKAGQEVAEKVKAGTITQAEAKVELKEKKEANYVELVMERKIGYLALLRNLRNILDNSSNHELIKAASSMLTDKKLIKQSLVFPHQIDLALEVLLAEQGSSFVRPLLTALNTAYELSIPNLTELFPYGKTAIVFDSSGSMSTSIRLANRAQGSTAAIEKAALIAATLAKGINADVFHFATSTHQIAFNPLDSVNTLKQQFKGNQGRAGYGTYFHTIANVLGKGNYDRVFIISDMQGADSVRRSDFGNAHIYNVNIAGYGNTMIKPGSKVYQLFGYTAELYELIKRVEVDPKVLLKAVEEIVI